MPRSARRDLVANDAFWRGGTLVGGGRLVGNGGGEGRRERKGKGKQGGVKGETVGLLMKEGLMQSVSMYSPTSCLTA